MAKTFLCFLFLLLSDVSVVFSDTPKEIFDAASVLFNNGKTEEAIKTVKDGIKKYPNEPMFYVYMGNVSKLRKEFNQSEGYFKKALKLILETQEL